MLVRAKRRYINIQVRTLIIMLSDLPSLICYLFNLARPVDLVCLEKCSPDSVAAETRRAFV